MPWTVFPLHPIVDGRCGCGDETCSDIGKHPAVNWGALESGTEIRGSAGHGIATGSKSGIFVVDVDSEEALQAFVQEYLPPETLTVKTGRGWQFYFQLPDFPVSNSVSYLGKNIDVRGEGGYVVAPGSPHKNGSVYKVVVNAAPAVASSKILETLANKRKASTDGCFPPPVVDTNTPEGKRRIAMGTVRCLEADPAIQGQGGSQKLWDVALYLIRRLELPLEVAQELIEEHYNLRCEPPWSGDDILHKLEDARDKSSIPTGISTPAWNAMVAKLGVPPAMRSERGEMFDPTNASAAAERTKIPFAEAVICLARTGVWEGVWRYNEFKRIVVAVNPPMELDAETVGLSDRDLSCMRVWFEHQGVNIGKKDIQDAIHAAAKRCSFHPVRDYLNALPKTEDTSILDTLAEKAFGSATAIENEFLKMTLVAAVRRVFRPGTKVDTMLVLQGKQGWNKSQFVEALFLGTDFCRSQMPDLSGRDASHALEGYWAVELAELDRIVRAETSTVKDFLSRRVDTYRQFGNGEKISLPRQCVFIGTTNQDDFLKDPSGNRRYWPIQIYGKIDIDYVKKNLDSIWAAAVELERRGIPHWLGDVEEETAEEARIPFLEEDPWTDMIRDYLCGKDFVVLAQVYSEKINPGNLGRINKNETNRIGSTLRKLGCTYFTKRLNNISTRGWRVPPLLSFATPSKEEAKRRKDLSIVEGLNAISN